jgi:hypothetical protein
LNIQFKELTPNALCSPQPVVRCHLLNQGNRLERESRLSHARSGFVFPKQTEKLTLPAQKRSWLDQKESLFPGPNHPGEEYQKKSIRLLVGRSFDLSMQDGQLLSQECIFRQ